MLAILKTRTIGADVTSVNSSHVVRIIKEILQMKTRYFSKIIVTAIEHITAT